jgi:hypothetical protein
MKNIRSIIIAALFPTVSIFSYPIFHGIQSTMNSVEGLDGLGMILAAIATAISAFVVSVISVRANLPTWLLVAYLGYCLTSIVLALLFEGMTYGTTKLYLTAIVFGFCLLAAGIGTALGRSMHALKQQKTP